jgi:hypothetical protein
MNCPMVVVVVTGTVTTVVEVLVVVGESAL